MGTEFRTFHWGCVIYAAKKRTLAHYQVLFVSLVVVTLNDKCTDKFSGHKKSYSSQLQVFILKTMKKSSSKIGPMFTHSRVQWLSTFFQARDKTAAWLMFVISMFGCQGNPSQVSCSHGSCVVTPWQLAFCLQSLYCPQSTAYFLLPAPFLLSALILIGLFQQFTVVFYWVSLLPVSIYLMHFSPIWALLHLSFTASELYCIWVLLQLACLLPRKAVFIASAFKR